MTAWTDYLARQGARFNDDSSQASLHFTDPSSEASAATTSTVVVPLLHLGTIRSVGPDSDAFINNIASTAVNKLAPETPELKRSSRPQRLIIASCTFWP